MKTIVHSRSLVFVLLFSLVSMLLMTGAFSSEQTAESFAHSVIAETTAIPHQFTTASFEDAKLDGGLFEANSPLTQKPRQKPFFGTVCPPPTVPAVNEDLRGPCTLGGNDVVHLTKTLRLASNTTLDCEGSMISPDTDGLGMSRSNPEVGILLDGVRNVTIRNCTIKGFNFGIFAVNSKAGISFDDTLRPRNAESPKGAQNKFASPFTPVLPIRIIGNTISAYFVGISLISVDNTEISGGNNINFPFNGGSGLVVERDSDNNLIQGNFFTATNGKATNPVRVPGPVSSTNPILTANPGLLPGSAVLIAQIGAAEPTLLNAIIEGHLYQLTTTDNAVPGSDFSDGNRVENNLINFPQSYPNATDGIALAVPQGTTIRDNRIHQAAFSIRVGTQSGPSGSGFPKTFPGTCSQRMDDDKNRRCFAPADCFISGIDQQQNNNETCNGVQTKGIFWVSDGSQILYNTIEGPFVGGVLVAGSNTVVRGNNITGPLATSNATPPPGLASPGAITLFGGYALDTSTITQNTVTDAGIALSLTSVFQNVGPSCIKTISCLPGGSQCLGARIFWNDFWVAGNPIAVQTDDKYALLSDLSDGGMGNFWGQNCFDPNQVQFFTTAKGINANVVDCNSYPKPVAQNGGGLPDFCLH